MKNNKEKRTKIYRGRFLPRLIILVLIVMGLTAISVFALVEAVSTIREGSVEIGEAGSYANIFLIFGSALILGTLLTVVASGAFLRPIKSLEEGMDKVAKGDFSIDLEGDNVTQIGRLMNNFNKMANDLSKIETFKNEFISNVSHEFKTPLANIQGYAMLLQNEDLTEEERKTYLDVIIDSVQTLSTMTTNILKLSKLENSKIIVDVEPIYVSEQIRQAVLSLETAWNNKDIEISLELDDELIVEANEDLLMQVWINVLGNAVKFCDVGGKIDVKTYADDRIFVEIRDNGIGMNEEVLSRIFEKFYQGDNSHSKEGNGLGLALAKKIVETFDGEISAKSQENVGSVFVIKLPPSKKMIV